MPYCFNCGKEHDANARFCEGCGFKFGSENVVQSTSSARNNPSIEVGNEIQAQLTKKSVGDDGKYLESGVGSLSTDSMVVAEGGQKDLGQIAGNSGERRITMKEYKVLTQKDKWFSGKFDPIRLEGALNAYAQQGWRVVATATAEFPGFFRSGTREEIVVIMEREQ